MKSSNHFKQFNDLSDRIMLLDGINDTTDAFKNITMDKVFSLTDFPNLGINEDSITKNEENEAFVTPEETAALVERKLRRERRDEGVTENQKQQVQGKIKVKKAVKAADKKHIVKLQAEYLINAAKNPNTRMNQEAIDSLDKKIARLEKLIEDRKRIVIKSKNKYNSNRRTAEKLQRVVNALETKKQESDSVQKINRIENKIRALTKRKINYLRKANNYSKLATLAEKLIEVAKKQIVILNSLKVYIENGNHLKATELINDYYKLGLQAKKYREIRITQKVAWSKQTKRAKLIRLRARRTILEKVIVKYKLKSKHRELSEEEQKEYKLALAKAEIIDKQINKLINSKLKKGIEFRPSFDRSKQPKPETSLSGININELYLVEDIEW